METEVTDKEYAYFCVSGPGSHETVTQLLGLQPSAAWNAGELNARGQPRHEMTWRLDSGLEESEPLHRHIDNLLLYLSPRSGSLRELWLDYALTLQCVGRYASSHGLHLDRELVRQLAMLGIAVDLDLYVLPADGGA